LDAAFALLLPLIAGYLYIRDSTVLRYKAAREDGHRLYFRIAFYGTVLFCVSLAMMSLGYVLVRHYEWFERCWALLLAGVKPLMKVQDQAAGQLALFLICLFSVALGWASPRIINRLMKRTIERALFDAVADNDLEKLLVEALHGVKTISVTLSSNKIYVGAVLTTPEPRSDRRSIAMLPYMSGYRRDDGKVMFTTFYDQVYATAEEGNKDEFRLVVPLEKIVTVSFFDVAVYARFNALTPEHSAVRRLRRSPNAADTNRHH
jgi:hypothetical protein